jgi:uncharacterized caspase-like protein
MKTVILFLGFVGFISWSCSYCQSGESDYKSINITKKPTGEYRGQSNPLSGTDFTKSVDDLQFGNYYALIIGIDNYKGNWPALKNAVNDARSVKETLDKNYKIDNFKTLYNNDATRANIIKSFEWLVDNVKENDNVFIYYSGHGDFKDKMNKGYWVPADAQTLSTSEFISNADIQIFLGAIKSKHTLLFSDACFSGDIFREKTISVQFEDSPKYYAKVNKLISRQALTSGGVEPVMDGGKEGHSVFCYYMLKGLNDNQSKYFDANQLFEFVKIPVVNNSDQTPDLRPVKNTDDEGGQFIFMKKQ